MTYHISKSIESTMDQAVEKVTASLKEAGFGVLTDIDIQGTLRNKLGVEFRPYRILGACNPNFAYQVLQKEDKVGVFLPCNVVLQEKDNGIIEVSAVDPVTNLQVVENPELEPFGEEIRGKLAQVIQHL